MGPAEDSPEAGAKRPHGDPGGGLIPLHRLEGFSDAVFAFAVTLLVVSLEVPRTAEELFTAIRGFPAFGICLGFLALIWFEHSRYFRAYPLTDGVTVALNILLLFVLLLYVYPLKFLFTVLMDQLLWRAPDTAVRTLENFHALMTIYGLGFLALNGILVLMKLNARRHAVVLGLGPRDLALLAGGIARNVANGLVALVSVFIALFTADNGLFGGFIYALLGPLNWWLGVRMARRARTLA
jgi:uncharacterized membrane protein